MITQSTGFLHWKLLDSISSETVGVSFIVARLGNKRTDAVSPATPKVVSQCCDNANTGVSGLITTSDGHIWHNKSLLSCLQSKSR